MTKTKRPLRVFLDKSIEKAKLNTHTGDLRTNDLTDELHRIAERVQKTLAKIMKDYEKSTNADADEKASEKLDETVDILTSELMLLSGAYHRRSDIEMIRKFLNKQNEIIRQSMRDDDFSSDHHVRSLDDRIVELHSLMKVERQRIRRAAGSEKAKFYFSITIAVISLSISVYALWFR